MGGVTKRLALFFLSFLWLFTFTMLAIIKYDMIWAMEVIKKAIDIPFEPQLSM